MVKIINLYNQKNHFLEKFYSINETELLNFAQGNFDNLEHFYQSREKILELIKILDQQIEETQSEMKTPAQPTNEEKQQIREALAVKDEYVNRILAQDLEILACIENTKSDIIRELQDIRKMKKAVGSYRSKNSTSSFSEEA